jgi:phenylalanyl-tRNA synthetase alpha chain
MTDIESFDPPGTGRHCGRGGADAIEHLARRVAGQVGSVTAQLKQLGALPPEQRKAAGEAINAGARCVDRGAWANARRQLKPPHWMRALPRNRSTSRCPAPAPRMAACTGQPHAGTHRRHLRAPGFRAGRRPEIEDDWHNFEALNFPPHHPARAMHDTFYFGDGRLLRTHTSGVQVRYMDSQQPPLRMIAAGKVYRSDSDQTHTPMFHQVEGLAGRRARELRRPQGHAGRIRTRVLRARFRNALPSQLFPLHRALGRSRHRLAAAGRFHALARGLGCGMVHPNVLRNVGIDPEKYTGYAFGMGVERFAMLRYGVDDLRSFFENDVRFLKQFA